MRWCFLAGSPVSSSCEPCNLSSIRFELFALSRPNRASLCRPVCFIHPSSKAVFHEHELQRLGEPSGSLQPRGFASQLVTTFGAPGYGTSGSLGQLQRDRVCSPSTKQFNEHSVGPALRVDGVVFEASCRCRCFVFEFSSSMCAASLGSTGSNSSKNASPSSGAPLPRAAPHARPSRLLHRFQSANSEYAVLNRVRSRFKMTSSDPSAQSSAAVTVQSHSHRTDAFRELLISVLSLHPSFGRYAAILLLLLMLTYPSFSPNTAIVNHVQQMIYLHHCSLAKSYVINHLCLSVVCSLSAKKS